MYLYSQQKVAQFPSLITLPFILNRWDYSPNIWATQLQFNSFFEGCIYFTNIFTSFCKFEYSKSKNRYMKALIHRLGYHPIINPPWQFIKMFPPSRMGKKAAPPPHWLDEGNAVLRCRSQLAKVNRPEDGRKWIVNCSNSEGKQSHANDFNQHPLTCYLLRKKMVNLPEIRKTCLFSDKKNLPFFWWGIPIPQKNQFHQPCSKYLWCLSDFPFLSLLKNQFHPGKSRLGEMLYPKISSSQTKNYTSLKLT